MIEVSDKGDLWSHMQKSKRALVLFYASWCPFCVHFLPFFNKNSSKQDVDLVLRVKVDDYDNPLWDDYSIEAVPTVIFFDEGNVSRRLDGRFGYGLGEQQFKEWLEEDE
jgi:thiol-disulfide isomerase/thioredoxin